MAALLERDDVRDLPRAHDGGPVRLGIVDPTDQRLGIARKMVARGEPWRGGRDIWFTPRPLLGPGGGKLAFVFPGVEAEFAPRTADIAAHFGLPHREWTAADLGQHGTGLVEVGKLLDATLRRMNVRPDAVAGHSIGEWTAAAVTGQMSTQGVDAFLGLFDADSVEVSGYAFAAISAPMESVTPLLDGYPGVVLSHDNAPNQCVVNGPREQVQRLVDDLRAPDDPVPAAAVPVGVPHAGVRRGLAGDRGGAGPLGGAPDRGAGLVRHDLGAVPRPTRTRSTSLFIRHMIEPVWFRRTVAAMYADGIRVFLQMGAGQLASLIDDNLRDRDHLAMPVNVSRRDGLAQLRRVATALWVDGGDPDLSVLDPAPVPAARPPKVNEVAEPSARKGPAIRIDLGGPLVKLGAGADRLLGLTATRPGRSHARPPQPQNAAGRRRPAAVPAAAAAGPSRDPASTAGAGRAGRGAQCGPVGAEQDGRHVQGGRGVGGPVAGDRERRGHGDERGSRAPAATPRPAVPRRSDAATSPPVGGPTAVATAGNRWARTVDGTGGCGRTRRRKRNEVVLRTTLDVSVDTMPYLRDHCFFVQPDDWPRVEDRWPVVPATTVVQHMMDAAEQAAPGLKAVAVRDAKFNRWLIAAPPQHVEITVKRAGPDRFTVIFGGYARSTVEMAADYPEPDLAAVHGGSGDGVPADDQRRGDVRRAAHVPRPGLPGRHRRARAR